MARIIDGKEYKHIPEHQLVWDDYKRMLKPCPCCGHTEILIVCQEVDLQGSNVYAMCDRCGVRTSKIYGLGRLDKMLEIWNERIEK